MIISKNWLEDHIDINLDDSIIESSLTALGLECTIKKEDISNFINPSIKTLENLEIISTNRVELYTYDYAHKYSKNQSEAIKTYSEVSSYLENTFPQIELNAGHDLNLENLEYFLKSINNIKEVSIGHALICDTFEFGLEKTIKKYLEILSRL